MHTCVTRPICNIENIQKNKHDLRVSSLTETQPGADNNVLNVSNLFSFPQVRISNVSTHMFQSVRHHQSM